MAKFKVGDKVKLISTGQVGTIFRVTTNFGFTSYWVKGLPGGPNDAPVYAEHLLMLANSRACNSVRGNTKLKDIDYWFSDNGYGDDTLIKYVPSYKKNRCIDFVDRYADTYARDKFYDAMYELTGIKNRWALNSRACNSSNQVVRKAMNAVAMNAQTLDVGMKIVKWNGRKFVDGICDSWEKGKRRITAKFNDGSVRSLFAKDLNVHSDVFLPSQITQPKFQKGDYLHLTNMIKGSRNVIGGVVTSMYPSHEPSNGMMIWFYNLKDRIGGISKGMWEGSLAKNSRIHTSISTTNPIVVNALTMNKEEWRTTEGGHKICIEDGVVTKGNPHVVSKMQGKKSAGSRAKSKTASTKGSSKVDDSKIKISSEYRDLEPVHARFMTLLDKDEEKAKDYWKRHKREIKRVDGGMSGDLAPDYPWMK